LRSPGKNGSLFRLRDKKIAFEYKNHWRILHNFLCRPAGKKEKNAESPNWWGLLVEVRRFFDEHPDGIE